LFASPPTQRVHSTKLLPTMISRIPYLLTLCCTMVQCVHTPARVLSRNLPKIQSQNLPSLYASLRTISPYMGSLFEFGRIAHPDGPFTPMREGSKDIFPRTAFIPHLEQLCILFFCPWNLTLLWFQRCLVCLGMYNSIVIKV
jgi:hypothetical protein